MWYVGLDVHLRHTNACVLNQDGQVVREIKIRGPWSQVVATLREWPVELTICYEASCGYGYLYEELSSFARSVTVAHPGQLRLIFRSKRKNDRVDAAKLAKLLYLGEVPQVHVPSAMVRAWRELIEYRRRLMIKRTRTKNGLRSLLRTCGVTAPKTWKLWTQEGLAWLRSVPLPTPSHEFRREQFLQELMLYREQLRAVDGQLAQRSVDHAGIYLLRTIPGIGPRTAEAVIAYVDDARRFKNPKAIGSYFGLVPSQDQSGSINRLGHISRQGPAVVRQLLVEASWQAVQRSPAIRAYFDRVRQNQQERTKLALVATAHYLLRVMLSMLKTGEVWRETIEAA